MASVVGIGDIVWIDDTCEFKNHGKIHKILEE